MHDDVHSVDGLSLGHKYLISVVLTHLAYLLHVIDILPTHSFQKGYLSQAKHYSAFGFLIFD